MITNQYIKSPLNYVGGKYKLLNQIIPLIPNKINTFVDLFGGGFNVGINVNADKIIYNDNCIQTVDLLHNFQLNEPEVIHSKVIEMINMYNLNRENKEHDDLYKKRYINLREEYNRNPDWLKFYTLITCSFSNQIRFNLNGEFNMPYGKRYYNPSLQEKLKVFVEQLHKGNYKFTSSDFRKLEVVLLTVGDYVYLDPPYFNSTATYNENGGWTERDEIELLNLLDSINDRGIKFGLSNNLKYDNPILNEWKDKYNIHYLNIDYSNCNYQKKDKSNDLEVLITNY